MQNQIQNQLQQIVQMQQRMFQVQQQMQRQMDQNFANVHTTQRASEFNSIARLQNSAAKHQGSTLTALHDTFTNLVIPGFPQTCAALAALDEAQIDAILTALGLDLLGTLAERRSLLEFFIGVPDT
ncbi:hypothetical protein A1O3_02566 [Capronia epimyces CBS 606.96]|uniref:Uncharacterized protein n=1 Tax=Capronia epimyces CBS 606.96 TaxID=1182542 RepID=W9Z4T3_9EURO|nr:uncharacterized protein A1O3_02566 [Capronia epimyces CBS 606.96]EXJ89499.1 hypothetical protein A1O3_02566 [Capronia epimyces CBS 606.96]